jgi:tetratricopeptide (TPR) repeat protein
MKSLTPQQIARLQNMAIAAQQARKTGMNAQAEGLYRDILKQAPGAWDMHHQLAILLAGTGRPQEATKHFRLIVKANSSHAVSHANLANALSESAEFDEAITEFQRAIELDPSLIGARIALGETLRRAKRCEEATDCFKAVLDHDKVNHAAFNGLGLVRRDMDDSLHAMECFSYAVGLAPKNAEYRMNFGVALRRHKLDGPAAEELYQAVMLKPDWLEAIVLLAEVLQEQRRYDEAKECYERALHLKPGNLELTERIGYVYMDMDDTEHALGEFHKVLSQQPERFMALLGVARAHMESGLLAESATALESLIRRYPDEPACYYYLAISRKFTLDDPLIPQLQALADRTGDERFTAIALSFTLGKIFDDCGQWDMAFKHYARGNRLRKGRWDYQPAQEQAKFDALISVFDQKFIESHRNLGVQSKLPVFIVGMPRSGTTLTEQIISSHPQVIGAGEVVFWVRAGEVVPYTLKTEQAYPQCMSLMTPDKAQEIAEEYSNLLRKIAGSGMQPTRITDKMPYNFLYLGLIALLFPNAPIIHCKRDAMDNCLSIFFQNFDDQHSYASDLTNLGHQHRQYQRLMAHWHEILPGRIFDINYEDTIADPEYWSRKLIDFVGLEWDDACLAPHKLERTVKTASQWQVRQPIYNTSVQRWKHYEKHLGPLKEALGLATEKKLAGNE